MSTEPKLLMWFESKKNGMEIVEIPTETTAIELVKLIDKHITTFGHSLYKVAVIESKGENGNDN